MRITSCLLLVTNLLLSSLVYAQISASTAEAAKPWTSLIPRDDDSDFYFAIVTDRTAGQREGVFPKAVNKLNLIEPAFVVSVGDFIEGYTENPGQLKTEWDEFEGFIEELGTPFFYTPGNHDMSNAVMADIWRQRFGPSFYHFTYKDVLFLSLNSELFGMVEDPDRSVPGPWQQTQQMEFIERTLLENSDARWTVVLIHQPLWDPGPDREVNSDWLAVEKLLGERRYSVFAGHYHRYSKARRHNRSYITLATTGGGSQLRGPLWGEFDHVALVKMTEDGPRISNLLLDGILDEDVSTVESREMMIAVQGAVVAEPVIDEGVMFSKSAYEIKVTNPLSVPLSISGEVRKQSNFDIAGLVPLTISPGETTLMQLDFSVAESLPYRELNVTAIDWQLRFPDERGDLVQVNAATPLIPLTRHRIAYVDQPLNADGVLEDWESLAFQVHQQGDVASPLTDPEDIAFEFDVKSDADSLNIAVAVTDDDVVSSASLLARLQDAVAIIVDTRADVDRERNMPVVPAIVNGFYGEAVVQILTLNGAATDSFISALKRWEPQVQSAVTATSTGYQLEMAIPHEVLDVIAGERWRKARIGIRVYDLDSDNQTIQTLHWQPYRYGNSPLRGTHEFIRDH